MQTSPFEDLYNLYADGSSSKNGSRESRGGWGCIVVDPSGNEIEHSGGEIGATNNQMELKGVIEGFKLIPSGARVRVVSDSEYVINGASKWIRGWVRKKWKGIKNADLWKELIQAVGDRSVKWVWVKGHSTHEYNIRCDKLATAAGYRLLQD